MSKPVKCECTVVGFEQLTSSTFQLQFQTEPTFVFKAGQYISALIPGAGPGGRNLRRAYSIASHPESPNLEICVTKVEGGKGSTYLHSLRKGDRFEIAAPFGDFLYTHDQEKHAWFIATGTGVSPFRSIAKSDEFKLNPPKTATVLFGVRHETDLFYENEFKSNPLVTWIPCLSKPSDNWDGFKGRVTHYLIANKEKIDWSRSEFYLCGNGEMINEAREIFELQGVDKKNVHREKYY